MEPLSMAVLGVSLVAALAMTSWAALKGWQGWLELKRLELSQGFHSPAPSSAGNRIEVADLKERIRKLEAIAAGIDL